MLKTITTDLTPSALNKALNIINNQYIFLQQYIELTYYFGHIYPTLLQQVRNLKETIDSIATLKNNQAAVLAVISKCNLIINSMFKTMLTEYADENDLWLQNQLTNINEIFATPNVELPDTFENVKKIFRELFQKRCELLVELIATNQITIASLTTKDFSANLMSSSATAQIPDFINPYLEKYYDLLAKMKPGDLHTLKPIVEIQDTIITALRKENPEEALKNPNAATEQLPLTNNEMRNYALAWVSLLSDDENKAFEVLQFLALSACVHKTSTKNNSSSLGHVETSNLFSQSEIETGGSDSNNSSENTNKFTISNLDEFVAFLNNIPVKSIRQKLPQILQSIIDTMQDKVFDLFSTYLNEGNTLSARENCVVFLIIKHIISNDQNFKNYIFSKTDNLLDIIKDNDVSYNETGKPTFITYNCNKQQVQQIKNKLKSIIADLLAIEYYPANIQRIVHALSKKNQETLLTDILTRIINPFFINYNDSTNSTKIVWYTQILPYIFQAITAKEAKKKTYNSRIHIGILEYIFQPHIRNELMKKISEAIAKIKIDELNTTIKLSYPNSQQITINTASKTMAYFLKIQSEFLIIEEQFLQILKDINESIKHKNKPTENINEKSKFPNYDLNIQSEPLAERWPYFQKQLQQVKKWLDQNTTNLKLKAELQLQIDAFKTNLKLACYCFYTHTQQTQINAISNENLIGIINSAFSQRSTVTMEEANNYLASINLDKNLNNFQEQLVNVIEIQCEKVILLYEVYQVKTYNITEKQLARFEAISTTFDNFMAHLTEAAQEHKKEKNTKTITISLGDVSTVTRIGIVATNTSTAIAVTSTTTTNSTTPTTITSTIAATDTTSTASTMTKSN